MSGSLALQTRWHRKGDNYLPDAVSGARTSGLTFLTYCFFSGGLNTQSGDCHHLHKINKGAVQLNAVFRTFHPFPFVVPSTFHAIRKLYHGFDVLGSITMSDFVFVIRAFIKQKKGEDDHRI